MVWKTHKLYNTETNFTVLWKSYGSYTRVPSHVELRDNEVSDTLAKAAAVKPQPDNFANWLLLRGLKVTKCGKFLPLMLVTLENVLEVLFTSRMIGVNKEPFLALPVAILIVKLKSGQKLFLVYVKCKIEQSSPTHLITFTI